MKGNSLETKRLNLLKAQGLEDKKFSEIIETSPSEYKARLNSKFDELSKYINEVKRINSSSMEIVKDKLSVIDTKLSKVNTKTYDPKGGAKNSSSTSSSLTKSI